MTDQALSEKLGQFLRGTWAGGKRIQGIQGGARAYLLALAAADAKRPLLVIAPNANQAENLYDDLAFFLGEERGLAPLRRRLHLFPSWEVLPFENLSPHPENIAGRLEGLYKLVEEPAPIIIATPAAVMQRVIPKRP
jgi:transcription-repair coupling factor (superfamily II helicase)